MRYPLTTWSTAEAFDGLPAEVKAAVYRRLMTRLVSRDRTPRLAHLATPAARAAAAILRETKPELVDLASR